MAIKQRPSLSALAGGLALSANEDGFGPRIKGLVGVELGLGVQR